MESMIKAVYHISSDDIPKVPIELPTVRPSVPGVLLLSMHFSASSHSLTDTRPSQVLAASSVKIFWASKNSVNSGLLGSMFFDDICF